MAFLTKKHLSRRTFLNGVGVTIALPFLESMVPAGTPLAQTAAAGRTRLGCIYVPHGATMDKWTPAAAGKGFELTEILQPLAPFRERVNVISDLSHPQAYGGGSATSNHNRSAATFLSGAHAEAGPQAHLGITMDQFAARKIGQDTPLPSLELMIEDATLSCGDGLSCAYRDTISWQSPTSPLPMQNNPRWSSSACSATAAPTPNAATAGNSRSACSIRWSAKSRPCSATCRPRIAAASINISATSEKSSGGSRKQRSRLRRISRCRTRPPGRPRTSKRTSS